MGAAPYAAVCGALTPPATRRRWGRRDDEGAGLLVFKKSGQGMGREILPRLRASVRPLQLHRAVERPARYRQLLERRAERADVDSVLRAAAVVAEIGRASCRERVCQYV